ncbi:hypothetical protein BGZ61DRAFT_50889 [Ilyonectria robusta]|uniref:uncharacterized protein n=1 Tax=Ilyonectria robusta TaxID=1079257 RepID=UPI001E8D5A0B|nr:uncharacterized protein BGZ61DRAFT_50889 [Ilyonectria robusta]KAH8648709.1 hypothetical protein BGZ61DRAFT_50889 [Ilyonectria robusta]
MMSEYLDEDDKIEYWKSQLNSVIHEITKDNAGKADLKSKALRDKYSELIKPLISPGLRQNFVVEIIGNDFVPVPSREFLLKTAVPGNWHLLGPTKPGADTEKGTALHKAIDCDKRKRDQTWLPASAFTSLLCDLMKSGLQTKTLDQDTAATILSGRRGLNGPTCLHLALMEDMTDAATQLIGLADESVLKLQRENGNTPLHDAVEFQLKTRRKFLVQAPRCSTPALRAPIADFSLDAVREENASNCCKRCLDIDEQYQGHKAKRAAVLHSLLAKGPVALATPNKAGMPPYLYHIRGREAFRKKSPNANEQMEQQRCKMAEKKLVANSSTGNLIFPESVRLPSPVPGQHLPQAANVRAARAPSAATTAPTKCPSKSDPDCFYLSAEVETLLWDASFRLDGYELARQCLFLATVAKNKEGANPSTDLNDNGGRDEEEEEEQHQEFKPNRSVTLNTRSQYARFKFLPTLAYVHLRVTPDPTLEEERIPKTAEQQVKWQAKASEALEELFKWLKERKKVKRVLKLVVEDNTSFPCGEATIQACLHALEDIRYLDWRRPNISVQPLQEAKMVVELWLYSTGINAVLSGWADKGGLQTLDMLRVINIDAKQGLETKETNQSNVSNFKTKLSKWYKDSRTPPKVNSSFESANNPLRSSTQGGGSDGDNAKPLNKWLDDVKSLTAKLGAEIELTAAAGSGESDSDADDENNGVKDDKDYVRVALIDDGLDPEWEGLGKFLSGSGWTHVPASSANSPGYQPPRQDRWSTPGRHQHGNRMAQLITTVCPFVRLFVAKIDSGEWEDKQPHPTFDVDHAIEAIHQAIRAKVEIISMSWSVLLSDADERRRKLRNAIEEASKLGILVYCAAREDKDSTPGGEMKAWPSSCDETFSIGAAHIYQGKKDWVGRDAQFHFPSENVLDSHDLVNGGTSAATALAAGLASLLLFCLKRNQRDRERDDQDKKQHQETTALTMQGSVGQQQIRQQQQQTERRSSKLFHAGEDSRGMIEKVFQNLSEDIGDGRMYVDVGSLARITPASYAAIATKYCEPHIKPLARKKTSRK